MGQVTVLTRSIPQVAELAVSGAGFVGPPCGFAALTPPAKSVNKATVSENVPAEAKETRKAPHPRWRVWLKRVVLTLTALVLVLVIFHRPLLRWGVDWGAHHFAEKAGYQLDWQFGGSVISGFELGKVRVVGPADGVLQSIELNTAGAEYSLMKLLRQGVGRFVNRVELTDAVVVLDLRNLKPRLETTPPAKKQGLPDVWLDDLALRNVTVRALTKDGEILLKNLTLVLKQGQSGELRIEELIVPQKSLHLEQVRGITTLQDRWIRLQDLQVMPDLSIQKLAVNLAQLRAGDLPLELDISSGASRLQTNGSLKGVGQEKLSLDLDLTVDQLADTELRRWVALPAGMTWQVNQLAGHVSGPPGEPQSLTADLALHATSFVTGQNGFKVDDLNTRLTMKSGRLEIHDAVIKSGQNNVKLSGQADLPPSWRQTARSPATVKFELDAPALEELIPGRPMLKGGVKGGGTLSVKDALLAGADLKLGSSDLTISQYSFSDFQVNVSTDAKVVTVHEIRANLNERTSAVVAGQVNLEGRQQATMKIALRGEDLNTLSDLKQWLNIYPPASGALDGSADVRFDVADLREKNFRQIQATGTLGLTDLKWNQGTLEKGTVNFEFKENKLQIRALDLTFDSQNTLNLTADLSLDEPRPLNVAWKAEFAQISALTSWIQTESVDTLPPPQAGVLVTEGRASANLADLKARDHSRLAATAMLNLKEVQWLNAALTDASVDLEVQQGKVSAKKLDIQFDEKNKVHGVASMELAQPNAFTADLKGGLTDLPGLSGWLELFKGPAINSGAVTLDWSGSGKLKPLEVKGNGVVRVKNFALAGNPNHYDLDLETRHEGRTAELTRLSAQFGKFRLEAAGLVSDTDLKLTELSVKSGSLALVSGRVSVPLALGASPRPKIPVDRARPVDVALEMKDLRFEELFAALGRKSPPVSGTVAGKVELKGLLADLTGDVDVKVNGLASAAVKGKLEPASVRLLGKLVPGRLTVEAEAVQRPLKPMVIKASLPVELEKVLAEPAILQDAPLQAELSLPESDLGFVASLVPTVERVQGTVVADVKLEGPLRRPSWRGRLRLNVPSAELAKGQMSVRDVRANLSFVEKKITIEDASAILAGGEIRASGGVNVEDLAKPDINVNVMARQALILRDDTMSLRADGNLAIRGPLDGASVSGRVELVRGRVFKEIEFLPLALPDQLPPPPPPVKRSTGKPAAPPPFDKWKLDVKVVTRDPVRLLGNVLNGAVVVDLHVGGTGGSPEVTGRSTLDNARVQLPFSRLNITRGNILFTKDRPLDPELDLQGDSVVGNYVVTLFAYGPALKPKVRFTSNPPLSEGEIATLLATGSTAGDLTSSEGVAANRAAFLLLSQTYRKLFRKAAPRRIDEEPPKLSFSFSPISTGNTQRAVTATYEINPRLQAIGEVSERGTFRGLLHYLVRFR